MLQNTLLINLLLRLGWHDYDNINIFGKSLFQPEYHFVKKAFDKKLPKEVTTRLFENQNEIMDLGISSISIAEEMAKDARDKSDVENNFYQTAEDVSDPREQSSEKKNLMEFDDLGLLLEKQYTCESYCQRKTQQRRLFLFSSKLFQAPTSNNQREREFHLSVSPRAEEP